MKSYVLNSLFFLFITLLDSRFVAVAAALSDCVHWDGILLDKPTHTPKKFLPGIVSTDSKELNAVFSPDGSAFYFSRKVGAAYKTYVMLRRSTGDWAEPTLASISESNSQWDEVDVSFSPDGNTMYYISNAPVENFPEGSVNIWFVENVNGRWGAPKVLSSPLNSKDNEIFPIIVNSGAMYFTSSRYGGFGNRDVYVARDLDDKKEVKNMGKPINSSEKEGDFYISPTESFAILTTEKKGGQGGADLYLVTKNTNGTWNEPKSLDSSINTKSHEYAPSFSSDFCYFFFTRDGDIYWMKADTIINEVMSVTCSFSDNAHTINMKDEKAEVLIKAKLFNWMKAFNSQNIEGVKASFSKKLIGSYQGSPDQYYDDIEKSYSFGDKNTKFQYDLKEIEEVEVKGELGYVRTIWTYSSIDLQTMKNTQISEIRSYEIWALEADGEWRIIRWISYPMSE